MEGFSLLKYWIGGSGGGGGGGAASNMRLSSSSSSSCSSTTITTVAPETGDSDDEGPFFDLEFTLPVEEEEEDDGGFQEEEEEEQEEGSDDDDRDSTFSSSGTGGGPPRPPAGAAANRSLPDIPFSPSENLFFKGGELMSLEPPSSAPLAHACDTNSKKQFPVSLLRSATKFRVFLLGFKKAKPSSSSSSSSSTEAATAKQQQQQQQSSFFTVKFKVEEVPIMSLFRRENSWRSSSCKRHSEDSVEDGMSASEEMKRLLKDMMNKYMKMLRPASGAGVNGRKGGGGERHRFSGQLSLLSLGLGGKPTSTSTSRRNSSISSSSSSSSPSSSWEEEERVKKQQRQGSLREVCRHLSKSRSVSSSTSVAPVATAVVPSPLQSQSQRRDDSLLQQQDGIQSAIAHCKRSLNAPLEVC